jgi:hypothetical protein
VGGVGGAWTLQWAFIVLPPCQLHCLLGGECLHMPLWVTHGLSHTRQTLQCCKI